MQPDIVVLRLTGQLSKALHLACSSPTIPPIFAPGDTSLVDGNNMKSYKNSICIHFPTPKAHL